MDQEARHAAAHLAVKHFTQSEIFKRLTHIACYFSLAKEFSTTPLIEAIWAANKKCFLPILTPEKTLKFAEYRKNDQLILNQYHIPEPVAKAENYFPAQQLDCVFVPLAAFDLQGHRLGTGGGYYDRTFTFLTKTSAKQPLLIGLAYIEQLIDELPFDEWDIVLDGVLTPQQLLLFKSY